MAARSLLARVLQTLEMLLLLPPGQLAWHGVWLGAQQHSSMCRLAAPGSQEQGASLLWTMAFGDRCGYLGEQFDNVGSGLNSQHGDNVEVPSPVCVSVSSSIYLTGCWPLP